MNAVEGPAFAAPCHVLACKAGTSGSRDKKCDSARINSRLCIGRKVLRSTNMRRFIEFVKSAGTIGGGSVLLAIALFGVTIGEHVWEKNVAVGWLEWLAMTFFCFGAYQAWNNTDKKLQSEIRKQAGARIEGKIVLGYLDIRKDDPRNPAAGFPFMAQGCCVTLYVDVVNHNDSPVRFRAADTMLKAIINGRNFYGRWEHIPAQLLRVDDNRVKSDVLIDFFDGFYFSNQLQKGDPHLGHIRFLVEDFDQSIARGNKEVNAEVVVTIVDTLSKEHTICATLPLRVGTMWSINDAVKQTPS